jgi:copper/silver efflux system protein
MATNDSRPSLLDRVIRFCLENKLVVGLLVLAVIGWGIIVAPFDWEVKGIERKPVPTDAIPDVGENQQIVFTQWMGRSPQDVEDQITYPLTVSLLGLPGVKTVRSYSFFGFSSIYIIFDEQKDFYWSRSRILEKLNSLPAGTLPEGVQPALGPDATALGQVYWYTLEGRDPDGRPAGGWDLQELRSVQDWNVRYALMSSHGVSEVASVGGFVQEYQIDVDPDAMRAYRVTLDEVYNAVRMSNIDVGARTIELNKAEYIIRGLGFVKSIADLEKSVVKVRNNVPVHIRDIARVSKGPAQRRGALDKGGAEAVGGVVVVRYGSNPLEAIKNVKAKIAEIAPGLPTKAVVDYRKTSRDDVARFAKSQGFEAFKGNDLDQNAWLNWLRTRPVKVDFKKTSREVVTKFAEHHGFAAFLKAEGGKPKTEHAGHATSQGSQKSPGMSLDQEAWKNWLKTAKSDDRPAWLIAPRDQWPAWVTTSQVTVVPFYDRTGLIYETLGTLNTALTEEILVTVIVVLIMVMHLRSSMLISMLLPLAVLMCFIAMKQFGVDANIVALSGIAIAIGTMVDMGIILCENILRHLDEADPAESRLEVVYRASSEVGSAVLTAVSTTIISFLPVFTMVGAEGKLFRPLAFTKTFALLASVIVALTIIPPAAHLLFARKVSSRILRRVFMGLLIAAGLVVGVVWFWWAGAILAALGAFRLLEEFLPESKRRFGKYVVSGAAVAIVGIMLAMHWLPLGPEKGLLRNFVFVAVLIGGLQLFYLLFQTTFYQPLLRWSLRHKLLFLSIPTLVVFAGVAAWLGPASVLGQIPQEYDQQQLKEEELEELTGLEQFKYELAGLRKKHRQRWKTDVEAWQNEVKYESLWVKARWSLVRGWDGLGNEFMPPLDEGSYLYMPSTMPHASIGESVDVLQMQDRAIMAIPEVESVVGKIGRVDSALDPAPVSMVETIVSYRPEYITDKDGHRVNYRYDDEKGEFARTARGNLIPDPDGRPYRLWRDHIRKPDDIWNEIVKKAQVPGSTSAPKLQPIAARLVMLQSGMRAPMGVKIKGKDLKEIEKVALDIERLLKQVPTVQTSAVIADRVVGKPYLLIEPDRDAIKRHGIMMRRVQDAIEVAIGGKRITTTVEGRERYPVRVRYMRELRDDVEAIKKILVPAPDGTQIPLGQLARIDYERGPQVLKSEDTFLVAYVLFDMKPGNAEVDVVQQCQRYLTQKQQAGELMLPAGMSYTFAGNYENQQRAQGRLMIVLPLAMFLIFLILYLQFRAALTTLLVFSGIAVAWAGGLILLWLYGQPWFLDFSAFGTDMRTLFQVHTINLSVAVWVGFLALFGIATDDGVVIATYLDQSFRVAEIDSIAAAREATVQAGLRRVRPCLMTTATTVLALLPVLTSTGRGSDIMVPMAIPSFGGMAIVILTMFIVPVLYCSVKEWKLRLGVKDRLFAKQP